jgi:hypothetical protein
MTTQSATQKPSLLKKKAGRPTSTQSFIEVEDIREHYVLMKGGNAAVVLEVQSTNFALLSDEERKIKLLSYASMLNSLSFPVQIVIQSKRVDVSSYIKSLENQARHITFPNITEMQKNKLASYILQYKHYIEEVTRVNTVLDKKFYLIIPYSSLEQGAAGAVKKEDFFEQVKASLKIKAESMLNQFQHLALKAKILDSEELLNLFHESFNGESSAGIEQMDATIVGGKV